LDISSPPWATRAPYAEPPIARSALVHRLIRAHNEAARERIREWFCQMDDQRLLDFGLTPVDGAILRGEAGLVGLRLNAHRET
jgi:hypothetical protein